MNLEKWLSELPEANIQINLVHDVQDTSTKTVLFQILNKINDDRINYLEGEFGSPGLTRNLGLNQIDSEWFWFIDADDLPYIRNVLLELESTTNEVDIVVGQYQVQKSGAINIEIESSTKRVKDIAFNPGIWRMIFRSKSFNNLRFRSFKMAEDQMFLIDSDIFKKNIKFSDKIFYIYFRHNEGQLSSQKIALSDLNKTIPLVFKKLSNSDGISKKSFEVMLVRQIGTQIKHSALNELLLIMKNNFLLFTNLNPLSQFRIVLAILRVLAFKLRRTKNE